jgi:hypothetical protein
MLRFGAVVDMLRGRNETWLLRARDPSESLWMQQQAPQNVLDNASRHEEPSWTSKSLDIAAPPDVVWSVMADASVWHEWTPSLRKMTAEDAAT